MLSIDRITLEVADVTAARRFYTTAFGLGPELQLLASDAPTSGFRGFTLSLIVDRPATVSALIDAAVGAGATPLKPAAKSFWGFGGVVQAPDGAIWKVATANKKDSGAATREIEKIALLLGVEDVRASKRFYVERGLAVGKSFGGKYVEFDASGGAVTLGLYRRAALAKDAGVPAAGSGSHRLIIGGGTGTFTDPDGFAWAAATTADTIADAVMT
jgi:uncharacterized glyoxalase superfamily protein PhnB